MNLQFYIPENDTLKQYIEGYYFIFDDARGGTEEYLTFPNNYSIVTTNLHSAVTFNDNKISIVPSAKENIHASLVYSYSVPLVVYYEKPIREITVYFKPLGLNRFVNNLEAMFSAEQMVSFTPDYADFEEKMNRIFHINDRQIQRTELEAYWLSKLIMKNLSPIENILADIEANMKIADIAQKNHISRKHLYKMVYKHLGKSPMDYRKVFRFRNAIRSKGKVKNLTELSYENDFYDQPHLVKDFKAFTMSSPHAFFKNVNIAGASIAVVKDGKVIHQKGYGLASAKTKEKVTANTNFQIASNTKAFTTAALAILVDEGKIKWEDKVKDHIPEFKMYNDYVTENFSIVDLLTHRSGLGLGAGDLTFLPDGADFKVNDLLGIFQHFKPVSPFRTKYNYDNLLYIIAGEIIARVSKMSFGDFIQQRIFIPLEMDSSFVGDSNIQHAKNLAVPHSTASGELKTINRFNIGMIGPAGGIYSNVSDMSKWMMTQLNKGRYGTDLKSALFSSANSSKMWTIQTVLPNYVSERYNTHFNGYGLGWLLNDMRGNLVAMHTGGLPGMLSQVTLVPDIKLGIVILTNTESGGGSLTFAVTRAIMDSYFGLDDAQWIDNRARNLSRNATASDEATKKVWAQVDSVKNIKYQRQDYIGMYEDKWFGRMQVFEKGAELWIRSLRSPKLNGRMFFYDTNTFAVKWEYQDMNCDAFITFSPGKTGKAQSFKMKGISPAMDFSFDFQDLYLERIN
ncbi:MAG: DUF3471 domain-containing protein [Chitinophagaceae bacterium]|nr:MAG: DUF3471 domain-containing protein [Chitinophagaceae bacterium]